jgi:uncharacterized protein
MTRMAFGVLVLLACMASLPNPASAQPNAPASEAVRTAQGQNATIGLITGAVGSTDARIGADIAQVVDEGDKLRILPMLGKGSVQNIADLIYLKGIDVAIVHSDVLAQTMQRNLIPKENTVQYITKLFQEEVHILATGNITSVSDLNGKPVSIGAPESGTDITASAVLDQLHVTPKVVRDAPLIALDRLRRGDIAAMFIVGGKPVPLLQQVEPGSSLHFLPIPLNAQLVDTYLPSGLDHQHYPNLIPSGPPIETVAVSSVLVTLTAAADTLRAKRVNRFVDTFFDRFDQFRQPGFHPKWQEVNLPVQVPGWTRYPEAQLQLKKELSGDAGLRTAFNNYLSQSGQSTSGLNDERREALFRDFLKWRDQHSGP